MYISFAKKSARIASGRSNCTRNKQSQSGPLKKLQPSIKARVYDSALFDPPDLLALKRVDPSRCSRSLSPSLSRGFYVDLRGEERGKERRGSLAFGSVSRFTRAGEEKRYAISYLYGICAKGFSLGSVLFLSLRKPAPALKLEIRVFPALLYGKFTRAGKTETGGSRAYGIAVQPRLSL